MEVLGAFPKHNHAKYQASRRRSLRDSRPFVEIVGDPWDYCTKSYSDALLVSYGAMSKFLPNLTVGLTETDRAILALGGKVTIGGRSAIVRLYRAGNQVKGGTIWLKKGSHSVLIHDVKPFLGRNYRNLPAVMDKVRAELKELDLLPASQQWHRATAIPMNVDFSAPPYHRYELCKPASFYSKFGHTDDPVFSRDMRSAYLSIMVEWWPELRRLYTARQYVSKPTERVLKVLATTFHGKCKQNKRDDLYYTVVRRVRDQMPTSPTIIQQQTDGYLDLGNTFVETGSDLGQFREPKVYQGLTIARTNNYWSEGRTVCHGALSLNTVTEGDYLQHLREDPFGPMEVKREVFNWNLCQFEMQVHSFKQRHSVNTCHACQQDLGGPDKVLHDVVRTIDPYDYE